jgi:hypothetical protein
MRLCLWDGMGWVIGFESLAAHQLERAGSLTTDGNIDWAGEPHRPEFGLGVEEHSALPARRDGFDTRRPNQIQPSVVSTEHAGLLTRAVVVRVHPEGPVIIVVGSWRNWQTRHVQTVQIGVRIPASRPSQRDRSGPFRGDAGPLGWPLRCQRRARRVRIPCVPPEWARRCGGKGR